MLGRGRFERGRPHVLTRCGSTKGVARPVLQTANMYFKLLATVSLAAVFLALQTDLGARAIVKPSKPNIIFLLTDDQDVTANSLDYMPKLNKILRKEGMEFLNYFVTTALCCPSRSTILKGQYCHNTGIWDNGDLNNDTFMSGGFEKWLANDLEKVTVGTIMQDAGFETFLVGKYLNGYSDKHASHVPQGWDHWHGMTDTAYFGPHFSDNGNLIKLPKSVYQTDYISNKSLHWMKTRDTSKPFFMYVAPFAPHAPSSPAPRHAHLFNDTKAPRYPSFNPDDSIQQEKPSWLGRLPKLTDNQIDSIDNFYRNRLRALQAVDEMLENITNYLSEEGILDNTYIFYMGDNGQHLGDYRLPGGKRQGYDTDIRVPFLVRGPGINGGTRVTEIVQNIDLLPTWTELAGVSDRELIPAEFIPDGRSMVSILKGTVPGVATVNNFRSASLAEMYGGSSNMGNAYKGLPGFEKNRFWNNTYQAIRVINGSDWAEGANWMYSEWCTGEREFYDCNKDPRQISNTIRSTDFATISKLSGLLEYLGDCKGSKCWNISYKEIGNRIEQGYEPVPLTDRLPCHNPPNMVSRMSHSHDISSAASCDSILVDGLPYSDDDVIPEHVLEKWETCSQQAQAGYNCVYTTIADC